MLFIKLILSTSLLVGCFASLFANSYIDSRDSSYKKECEELKKLEKTNNLNIQCFQNYHHFNSDGFKKFYNKQEAKKSNLLIASFNFLHPGQRKTLYKDFGIVAKMLNKWDIVAGIELQAVLGNNRVHNRALTKLTKDLKKELEILKQILSGNIEHSTRELVLSEILEINENLKILKKTYRTPGYLKILKELRKLDPSWALLISPQGEALKKSDIHELVGFYYRSRKVKPFINRYCNKFNRSTSSSNFACLPLFDGSFLKRPLRKIFSRRPFMANFESGHFDATLLANHVVYNSPKDPERKKIILKRSYNLELEDELPKGINQSNYARFAEIKATMDFINKLKQSYGEKDIILMGDFNLKSTNVYWDEIIQSDQSLLIKQKTSLTFRRFDKNSNPTLGTSKNFDHFIASNDSSECQDSNNQFKSSTFNFLYNNSIATTINKKYKIRIEKTHNNGIYQTSLSSKQKSRKLLQSFIKKMDKKITIKYGHIVRDNYKYQDSIDDFKRRVLDDQLRDRTYYRLYIETISDHLPITLQCSTHEKDDDRRL